MKARPLIVERIMADPSEPHVKEEALHMLYTGRIGESDGPPQRCLNYAVAAAIRSLPDPQSVADLILAAEIFGYARTQRTTYLPDAYLTAREAYEDYLVRGLHLIPRSVLPDLWMRAKRARLFREKAESSARVDLMWGFVRTEGGSPIFGPKDKPTALAVVATRPAGKGVWWLELDVHGQRYRAEGYFGNGVLSERSVTVQAFPLRDADGSVVGVEAVATVRRKDRSEHYGAEWVFRQDPYDPQRWLIRASRVGQIYVHAYPPNNAGVVRQGDTVFVRIPDKTDVLDKPESGWFHRDIGDLVRHMTVDDQPLADRIKWVHFGEPYTGAPVTLYGPYAVVKGHVVVRHPDHPSVRLDEGIWAIVRGSRSVVPDPRYGD